MNLAIVVYCVWLARNPKKRKRFCHVPLQRNRPTPHDPLTLSRKTDKTRNSKCSSFFLCIPGLWFLEAIGVARTRLLLSVCLQLSRGRVHYEMREMFGIFQFIFFSSLYTDDHGQRYRLCRSNIPTHPNARLLRRWLENNGRRWRSKSRDVVTFDS